MTPTPVMRRAKPTDVFALSALYFKAYQGTYPDPLMTDFSAMERAVDHLFWFVSLTDEQIVASVIFAYDQENLLGKSYAAVVDPDYRGHNYMQSLMAFGMAWLKSETVGVDVIYATTRTVHTAAQILTERLGYKKIGVFPNVRRAATYETHGLTAWFSEKAFLERQPEFILHRRMRRLYKIVCEELDLQPLPVTEKDRVFPQVAGLDFVTLEYIDARAFVQARYASLKKQYQLDLSFYPFHEPNCMVVSPQQEVEVFLNFSDTDGHCVFVGGKIPEEQDYAVLMERISEMLHRRGARYLEIILRADQVAITDCLLTAKFIPSAYFPAFQRINGVRYDFGVFSRTFEIFDFQNLQLSGINQRYLESYFKSWQKIALLPSLLSTDESDG